MMRKRFYQSKKTDEVVETLGEVIRSLISKDYKGKLFLNIKWKIMYYNV